MYERFTDRSRKVMQLANQEAQRFNHEYIGTEHVLIGLIKEGNGVAANVLKNLGVDLHKARVEVEKLIQYGPSGLVLGKLPITPRVEKVFDHARACADELGHNYVGTEHFLVGLVREQEGAAYKALLACGLTSEIVEGEVMSLLGYVEGVEESGPDYRGLCLEVKALIDRANIETLAKIANLLKDVR